MAILALTLGVAAYARRLVNRAQVPAAGAARLRRTVGIEVAATAVVLGLSAVLVQVNPGRSAATDAAAVVEDGVSADAHQLELYTLQFNIYPVQLGENNTVHAFLYTPEGKPLPAEQWTVTALLVGQDLEPVTMPLAGAAVAAPPRPRRAHLPAAGHLRAAVHHPGLGDRPGDRADDGRCSRNSEQVTSARVLGRESGRHPILPLLEVVSRARVRYGQPR